MQRDEIIGRLTPAPRRQSGMLRWLAGWLHRWELAASCAEMVSLLQCRPGARILLLGELQAELGHLLAQKCGQHGRIYQGSANLAPDEDRSFDLIVCFGGWRQRQDPAWLIRSLQRRLRPGGMLAWGDRLAHRGPAPSWLAGLLPWLDAGFRQPPPRIPEHASQARWYAIAGQRAYLVTLPAPGSVDV
ncbi:class I SAM-dependent methyltransferase [Chitinilyticum litopenaei]|uniref:class I SAM-dependent methyltransferase n=1 Tax=Chitinilyticum litopenaei TaxID=1121276 RepID=UPI001185E598|nr:class I SAM-dependent methyltransferase [Chitinilyticum litopenaei]